MACFIISIKMYVLVSLPLLETEIAETVPTSDPFLPTSVRFLLKKK